MYFEKSFSIRRHSGYYKNFQEFIMAVKYYLKKYKNDDDVEVTIDKDNFAVVFTGKNNTYFY